MMERNIRGLAVLRYLDGEYKVLSPGTHVVCAVTGAPILLEELRYWNVDLQEAYASAEAANKRFRELNRK